MRIWQRSPEGLRKFKGDFKRCSLKSGLVDVNGKCDKNGESGKNGIFAMRLANIPIILESGDFDEI